MKIVFLFLALAVGMINSISLYADNRDDLSDQILQLVKEGKLLSLESLMDKYEGRLQGRLLDVEVENKKGQIIYELVIMRDNSIVYEIKIDAQTGEWLEEEVEH